MINPFKRRWAELAPFRESVLVHFTRPGLRQRLQNACEAIVDEALELEEGPGFGEPWLQAGSRAGVDDLWHTLQALLGLASTRRISEVTEEEDRLCQVLETVAQDLARIIAELERYLGPPPPELPFDAARRATN
ncbi:MAG TPA: hypothetical protein VN851_07685 [Thermoanaerobaculia bacterium]|nr:hypothetical protein [Thermoanaerobaculia bacterium]